jgi:phenolic acid decarboxylase
LKDIIVNLKSNVEAYLGTFLYKYHGGNTYKLIVSDNVNIYWECVEGSEIGANGNEKAQRFEVAPGIYFATWVEKSGVNVSQALNFNSNTVFATIVEGTNRYVLTGDIERLN